MKKQLEKFLIVKTVGVQFPYVVAFLETRPPFVVQPFLAKRSKTCLLDFSPIRGKRQTSTARLLNSE